MPEDWRVLLHLLKSEYLYKLFGILLHERFVYSPTFIYLILYTYIWIYGYSFYTLGYYPLKCLAIGSSFSWLLYPFGIHPSLYVCVFEHFLTFWRCMKLQAHLIYFCPKSYSHPENGIRNPDLGTRCAFANWDEIAFRCSQLTEPGDICMDTNMCVHTHISRSIFILS